MSSFRSSHNRRDFDSWGIGILFDRKGHRLTVENHSNYDLRFTTGKTIFAYFVYFAVFGRISVSSVCFCEKLCGLCVLPPSSVFTVASPGQVRFPPTFYFGAASRRDKLRLKGLHFSREICG